jgi:hypothetical protein
MCLTSLRVCPGLLALVDDLFLCVYVYILHSRLQILWRWNGDCLRWLLIKDYQRNPNTMALMEPPEYGLMHSSVKGSKE